MTTHEQAMDCGRCGRGDFPPTQWTIVLTAGQRDNPAAENAMNTLCAAYWFPLYAFARRRGHPHDEAEDLTQEYFARLLKKDLLCGIKREGGKFRSYLLTTFKCFLVNEWHRARAQKRGNGQAPICIDDDADARYARELVTESTPETLFKRQWALTVLERVLSRVEGEYTATGKRLLFDTLRGCLPGAHQEACYRSAAAELQMTETALRMAVTRVRRRYGELLRREIAATLSDGEDVDAEIRELIEAVGPHA